MNRTIVGGILGGLALYVWGAISWMALPWHNTTMKPLPGGEKVIETLKAGGPTSAVYQYPSDEEWQRMAQTKEASATGTSSGVPFFIAIYVPNMNPSNPGPYVFGLILSFLVGIIAAYLLSLTTHTLDTFGKKATFVTMIGFATALFTRLSDWNWMGYPTDYTLVLVADTVIGFFLAGIVLAWYTSRTPATVTT